MKSETIFIVSDGSGRTAERLLRAALTQFEGREVELSYHTEIRTREQIHAVIHQAVDAKALVAHTLVSNELREYMLNEGRTHNIGTIDLMGPVLSRLTEHLAVNPKEKPGLFSQLNAEYFRRIETMDFAIKHDDGQRLEGLTKAEIVLVGVSRTFKTPLSMYLAFKGWFVANVPMVPEIAPPAQLKLLQPGVVIGLTMQARRLATLRSARGEFLFRLPTGYTELDSVRRELIDALRYYESEPAWPVIDVTGKPIEEIAETILAIRRSALAPSDTDSGVP